MKILDLFKSKNKIHQQTQREWGLKMSSIIPQEQVAKLSVDDMHNRVRSAEVSQNCATAAEDYFEIIAPICPDREDAAHSLMRIAMRTVFYLGVTDYSGIIANVKAINQHRPHFLEWVSANGKMVETIIKELTICCFFYDLKFDIEKNVVILNHKRSEIMRNVFYEVSDRDIFNEFLSFDNFKAFFYSMFDGIQISQDELDRLILEEDYKVKYFDLMQIKSGH